MSKPKKKLMEEEEMRSRFRVREDPVELSIEKWERILKYLETENPANLHWYYVSNHAGSGSCALCKYSSDIIMEQMSDEEICSVCPYYMVHGDSCDGAYPGEDKNGLEDANMVKWVDGSPYDPFYYLLHINRNHKLENMIYGAKRMIEMLKELR